MACLITLWTRFGAPADDNFAGSDPGQTLLNQHFQRQSAGDIADPGHPLIRADRQPRPSAPG